MKTIRKLTNRKLDELQDRLNSKLRAGDCCNPRYRQLMYALSCLMNERLRRIGL